jgi:hypothetical protein
MGLMMEQPPRAEKKTDWREYLHALAEHKEHNEPFALEAQLLEEHPVLPGEKEVYEWLVEVMGDQQLRVQLDKDAYHVIPRPMTGAGGDSLRQD